VRQFFSGRGENLRGPGPWLGVDGNTQSVYYRDRRGREPAKQFLEDLPRKPREKLVAQIEEHLNGRRADTPPPEFPITSQIDGELRELRIRFSGTHYRILYQRSRNLIVLLHAFEKTTAAVPASDKAAAKWRMADFKRRMNETPRKPPRPAGTDAP
jgi:phage-related protein